MNITHGEATHRTGKGFLDNSKLGEAEKLRETNARARKGLSTRCHGAKMHKAWSRPRPAVSRSARRKDFHVPLKHLVCCVPRPPASGPFQEHVPRPGVRRRPRPPGHSSLSPKHPVLCLLGPLASRLPCRSTRPHLPAPFKSGFLRAVSRDPQPGASCPLCLHHLPLGLLGRGRLLSGRGCPMPALGLVGGWELHGLLRGRNRVSLSSAGGSRPALSPPSGSNGGGGRQAQQCSAWGAGQGHGGPCGAPGGGGSRVERRGPVPASGTLALVRASCPAPPFAGGHASWRGREALATPRGKVP